MCPARELKFSILVVCLYARRIFFILNPVYIHSPALGPVTPCTATRQGCQVGLFEAKYNKFGLFLMFGLGIFENLLSSWPFFQVYAYLEFGLFSKSLFSKIQNLAFFSYKLLATLPRAHGAKEKLLQSKRGNGCILKEFNNLK